MIGLAGALAFLAVFALIPAVPLGRLRARAPASARPLLARAGRAAPMILPALLGGFMAGLPGAALGAAATVIVAPAATVVRRARARKESVRLEDEVIRGCHALAGRLRIGLVPAQALAAVAQEVSLFAEVGARAAVGGRIPEAIREAGVGRVDAVASLAAAWQVSARSGASLVEVLEAQGKRLTARRDTRRLVAAELAAPRATGRTLATLPAVGLCLGYFFGGDPLAFLTGSFLGWSCLIGGLALACVGVAWTERLADQAAR